VTRSPSDSWSITRSLAFLAATFAIVLGSLLPSAAMAGPGPDQAFCSQDGLMDMGDGQPGRGERSAPDHCPACIMPLLAALPTPPAPEAAPLPVAVPAALWAIGAASPPPPARAPPRPPSTAPPHA
jgi:hypothetical protein